MKKTNRMIKISVVLALILTMVLCLGACGASKPKVDDASGASGNLTWEYKQDTKTLTVAGVGEMKDFENAAAVDWAEVRDGVEKIVVGNGVRTVGDYAFYNMPYAKEISVSDSVTEIGDYAFAFCGAVEEISIPDSVTVVGDSAFEACTSLKSIVLGPSVTSLGERAFALCSSMTDATVVASISELPAQTFYYCKSLSNLILHTGIAEEDVHESAFELAAKGFADAERRDTVEGSYEIEIVYVFEDGSEAAPTVREEKLNGEGYLYISPELEGYTPDKSEIQGEIKGSGVRETVTYTENAEEETTPAPEETTEAPTADEEENSTVENIIAVVILALVIVGIVVGGILLVRSDKKKQASKNGKKK